MRTIRRSTAFERDLKRMRAGQHGKRLNELLRPVLERLVADLPLPVANRDHPLTGEWSGYRECHVRPDLLLVYAKPDPETLGLVRLGSHSALFG
jgi:mRNA interferase YafQ